jgi:hypothetical protein
LQLAIFNIFLDLHIKEFLSEEVKYITISQICVLLKEKEILVDDDQVRNAIYYIRSSIKTAHKHLNTESIIESKKWKGYRLGNGVFLKKI